MPSISLIIAGSLGFLASKSSATLGSPPVISLVLDDSFGILAITRPALTSLPSSMLRIVSEIFRESDIHLGLFFNYFSLGTLLSMATLVAGLVIIISVKKNEQNN